MKIESIDVNDTIDKAKDALKKEKNISQSTKMVFDLLLTLIVILVNRLGLNSKNSSKPPSTDTTKDSKDDGKKKKPPKKIREGKRVIKVQPLSRLITQTKLRY